MSWYLRASVTVDKESCISLTIKPRSIPTTTSTTCYQSSSMIAILCWQINSYSSKMELLPIHHNRRRIGFRNTVLTSSVSMNDRLTHQISTPLDYHVWGAMLHMYQKLSPKPANREQLKLALEKIWDELPQDSIKKAVLAFRKGLRACVAADG